MKLLHPMESNVSTEFLFQIYTETTWILSQSRRQKAVITDGNLVVDLRYEKLSVTVPGQQLFCSELSLGIEVIVTYNPCAILTNVTSLAEKIRDKVNRNKRIAANTPISWK